MKEPLAPEFAKNRAASLGLFGLAVLALARASALAAASAVAPIAAELDWVYKWAPVEFENRMGVKLRELKAGEDAPKDTRDLWVRDNVVRIHNQPIKATHGGEYLSVKFTAENQIIARRASHLTFTEKEIYRSEIDPATGDTVQVMAEPYKDIYSPEALEQMEKNDKIKVLWKRPGTASAGSVF